MVESLLHEGYEEEDTIEQCDNIAASAVVALMDPDSGYHSATLPNGIRLDFAKNGGEEVVNEDAYEFIDFRYYAVVDWLNCLDGDCPRDHDDGNFSCGKRYGDCPRFERQEYPGRGLAKLPLFNAGRYRQYVTSKPSGSSRFNNVYRVSVYVPVGWKPNKVLGSDNIGIAGTNFTVDFDRVAFDWVDSLVSELSEFGDGIMDAREINRVLERYRGGSSFDGAERSRQDMYGEESSGILAEISEEGHSMYLPPLGTLCLNFTRCKEGILVQSAPPMGITFILNDEDILAFLRMVDDAETQAVSADPEIYYSIDEAGGDTFEFDGKYLNTVLGNIRGRYIQHVVGLIEETGSTVNYMSTMGAFSIRRLSQDGIEVCSLETEGAKSLPMHDRNVVPFLQCVNRVADEGDEEPFDERVIKRFFGVEDRFDLRSRVDSKAGIVWVSSPSAFSGGDLTESIGGGSGFGVSFSCLERFKRFMDGRKRVVAADFEIIKQRWFDALAEEMQIAQHISFHGIEFAIAAIEGDFVVNCPSYRGWTYPVRVSSEDLKSIIDLVDAFYGEIADQRGDGDYSEEVATLVFQFCSDAVRSGAGVTTSLSGAKITVAGAQMKRKGAGGGRYRSNTG